jgi:hypothetical protein
MFGGSNMVKRDRMPVKEFCALVDIITKKCGKSVMVSECDKIGHMHFSKDKKHLGYIDINTGSLVWDEKE